MASAQIKNTAAKKETHPRLVGGPLLYFREERPADCARLKNYAPPNN